LDEIEGSVVIGADASEQMIDAARRNLNAKHPNRFHGFLGNFNLDDFWRSKIDQPYDFIVSSAALHYLSDERRRPFFSECFTHLKEEGKWVANIGTRSDIEVIAEMQKTFRIEYAYEKLSESRDVGSFTDFRTRFEEKDSQAKVNWKSYHIYVEDLLGAGFQYADVVRQHWVRSTLVAIK
jgi:trans-aconitate methyltransferase